MIEIGVFVPLSILNRFAIIEIDIVEHPNKVPH